MCVSLLCVVCVLGAAGVVCDESVGSDRTCSKHSHCKSHGDCREQAAGVFGCECHSGFTGADCGLAVPLCPQSCRSGDRERGEEVRRGEGGEERK